MTPVTYRPMRAEEEEEALDLWERCYEVSRRYVSSRYRGEPARRPEWTLVAVEDGRIVSTVHRIPRTVRRPSGEAWHIAIVGYVATDPASRRRGHSGVLLRLTAEALEREGCAWAMLFTHIPGHYAPHGWRTLPSRYREGALAGRPPASARWVIDRWLPGNEGWTPIARVYSDFNSRRPLSTVRGAAYWSGYAGPQLLERGGVILVALPEAGAPPTAYARAQYLDGVVAVTECGALTGSEAALPALMGVIAREARARRCRDGRAYLPCGGPADTAVHALLDAPRTVWHEMVMLRAMAPSFDLAAVEAACALPGAIFWPTDDA